MQFLLIGRVFIVGIVGAGDESQVEVEAPPLIGVILFILIPAIASSHFHDLVRTIRAGMTNGDNDGDGATSSRLVSGLLSKNDRKLPFTLQIGKLAKCRVNCQMVTFMTLRDKMDG